MNIAVFCSGNGSNFQAIVDSSRKGLFRGKIALMVCDQPGAYVIKRAEKEKIKTLIVERASFPSKQEFEASIIQELEKEHIELICLAGYMRILSPDFVRKYRDRILNIHPAILPSFKGTQAIKDALDYGAKVTGVTVHFVNEDMDAGPILLQEAVKIEPGDTEESLAERIHSVEHRLYPEAIRLFTKGRLEIMGRVVRILSAGAAFFLVFGFDSKAMFGREVSSPLLPVTEAIFCRETLPALPQKERPLSPAAEYIHKLDLTTPSFYAVDNYVSPNQTDLLNPDLNIERPLTIEEVERMRIEGSIEMARVLAEAMDSVNAKFAHKGINNLIDAAVKVIDFREYIGNKYNLHLRVEIDQALLRYKRRF